MNLLISIYKYKNDFFPEFNELSPDENVPKMEPYVDNCTVTYTRLPN